MRSAIIAAAFAVLVWSIWYMVHDVPPRVEPAPDPQPAALAGANIAYVPYVFADQATGCQYLSTHTSTDLVPRIAADGKTHMGCKGAGNGKS